MTILKRPNINENDAEDGPLKTIVRVCCFLDCLTYSC